MKKHELLCCKNCTDLQWEKRLCWINCRQPCFPVSHWQLGLSRYHGAKCKSWSFSLLQRITLNIVINVIYEWSTAEYLWHSSTVSSISLGVCSTSCLCRWWAAHCSQVGADWLLCGEEAEPAAAAVASVGRRPCAVTCQSPVDAPPSCAVPSTHQHVINSNSWWRSCLQMMDLLIFIGIH